jgi:hypothetical protein
MMKTIIRGGILLVLVSIQGCALGYNSVLFATKSNIGVDVDTSPPNLEVAISRQEGVFEPTFEGGQTVPVMSSFTSKTNSFTNFFWGVGSTFSTGEAAFTMSYLYDSITPNKSEIIPYERVTLTTEPKPKLPFGIKVNYLKPGEVLPVIFGTDTNLGLKIKWSGQTAQYPSSFNIGFKRKEMTLAPVAIAPNRIKDESNINNVSNKPLEVDMPSLLATIDTGVAIAGSDSKLSFLQYFATGAAANNLARQYAVREAMLKRADPGQELQMQRAKQQQVARDANSDLISNIATSFNSASTAKKDNIINKAKELSLVGNGVTEKDFTKELGKHSGSTAMTNKLAELSKTASN